MQGSHVQLSLILRAIPHFFLFCSFAIAAACYSKGKLNGDQTMGVKERWNIYAVYILYRWCSFEGAANANEGLELETKHASSRKRMYMIESVV